jgi:hypothetical protein
MRQQQGALGSLESAMQQPMVRSGGPLMPEF